MMSHWFQQQNEDLHRSITDTIEAIHGEQSSLRTSYSRWTDYYRHGRTNIILPSLDNRPRRLDLDYVDVRGVVWNVCRAAINALVSKISVADPKPAFNTTDGPEILQQKARKFEQFTWANLNSAKVYVAARKALRLACVYGTAAIKFSTKNGKISCDAIHPSNLTIDDLSSPGGVALNAFETMRIGRNRALQMFSNGDQRQIIKNTPSYEVTTNARGMVFRDLIELYEAWHISSGNGDPGRHVICTQRGTLIDGEWKRPNLPFSVIRFGEDLDGWHGISLINDIEGIQEEINETIDKISGNMEHLSVSFIYKDRNSQISDESIIDNRWYKIIEGVTPPQVITPPAVHPQVFEWLDRLWSKAFEVLGLDRLQATAANPALPRMESGRAIRMFHDIQTERFSELAKQYSQLIVDSANLMLQVGRDELAPTGWRVRGLAKEFLQSIDWESVQMDEHEYHLSISPASALSQTPSGRLADVAELAQGGLITREEALQLTQDPDLQKFYKYVNAPTEDLEAVFEHMIDSGDYLPPVRFQNLQLGLKIGTHYWARSRIDKKPEDRIELIARWLEEAAEMLTPPEPEPTAVAGNGGAGLSRPSDANMLVEPMSRNNSNEQTIGLG